MDPTLILILGTVTWVLCGLAGARVAYHKGRSATVGAAWGLVLGLIGLLVVYSLSADREELRRREGWEDEEVDDAPVRRPRRSRLPPPPA